MTRSNTTVDILRRDVGPKDVSTTWQEFNALADVARSTQRSLPGSGTLDGSASASRLPPTVFRDEWFPVINRMGETLPQFSTFRVTSEVATSKTGQQLVLTSSDSNLIGYPYIITNGHNEITFNSTGWCRIIDRSRPTKLRGDLSAGEFCGPNHDPFAAPGNDYIVSTSGFGLMAVGGTFSEGTKNFVWAMESPKWPMLCTVTDSISAAAEACTPNYSLGSGIVKVLHGDQLLNTTAFPTKDPHLDTIPWSIKVINPHEVFYPVDQLLMIQEVLNFGHMVLFSCPCS